jgi:hypothetical protein
VLVVHCNAVPLYYMRRDMHVPPPECQMPPSHLFLTFRASCVQFAETGRPPVKVRDEEGNYDQDLVLREWLTPRPPTWADGAPRKVQAVACGANHLLVIAIAGQDCATTSVYSCGLNNYGQLGHGDSGDNSHRHALTRVSLWIY